MRVGRAGKWLAVSVAAALLATACSGGDDDEARSSSTTTTTTEAVDADPVVPAEGEVLAEVEGVGEILEGFAVFGAEEPDVEASAAGSVPDLDGVLAAGPGLAGDFGTPFTGALQVRLDVPEPPTDDAIPVAVHRDSEGRVSIEPALWDPGTSQMVVWATSLSDRWGAWFDPRNWIEEVVQVGQGAFDFVADFLTGRTDPPACRNDPPGWASVAVNEVSPLHVCAQANPADDGAERFELFLKSNRRTAQLVTVPSVAKDYVFTENMPDEWRQLLTSLAGVDATTNMVVLGELSMSVGFRQPEQGVDFEMLAYQTPRIIGANPVLALLGNLPLKGTLGALAAVAKCHSEASGIEITRFDAITDSNPPDVGFLEGMVWCAFKTLQHPELAFGVVREVAGAIGMNNAAVLDDINGALRALVPTVARIASGLAIGSTLTNLWDGIFDNLADGPITVSLTGTQPTAIEISVDYLFDRFNEFDEACRGNSGSEPATWRACDVRAGFLVDLASQGSCPSASGGLESCGLNPDADTFSGICPDIPGTSIVAVARVTCTEAAELIGAAPAPSSEPFPAGRFTCVAQAGAYWCGDYGVDETDVSTSKGAVSWRT